MQISEIVREANRRSAAKLASGTCEAVTGRPDRVARKMLIWTPELDLRVLDATPEELMDLSRELDASIDRMLRRRQAILASTNQEMLS